MSESLDHHKAHDTRSSRGNKCKLIPRCPYWPNCRHVHPNCRNGSDCSVEGCQYRHYSHRKKKSGLEKAGVEENSVTEPIEVLTPEELARRAKEDEALAKWIQVQYDEDEAVRKGGTARHEAPTNSQRRQGDSEDDLLDLSFRKVRTAGIMSTAERLKILKRRGKKFVENITLEAGCLHPCLFLHHIPVELRSLIMIYYCQSLNSHSDLKWAVKVYFNPQSNQHLRAMLRYGHISCWDTSRVIDMHEIFLKRSSFNENIEWWDVSQVVNMGSMFAHCYCFNQPLNRWKVSNCTNMSSMFWKAGSFNQSLNDWDVSQVRDMTAMFAYASAFNSPLSEWDVSQVTDMSFMFTNTSNFNQPLNNWNVCNVKHMENMFDGAEEFNQPLDQWSMRIEPECFEQLQLSMKR